MQIQHKRAESDFYTFIGKKDARFTKQGRLAWKYNPIKALMGVESSARDLLTNICILDKCGQNSFDLFLKKILPLIWAVQDLATFPKFASWTHTFFTQFYNVKWVKKKNLLNLVFGSKMGTHRNEWEKL